MPFDGRGVSEVAQVLMAARAIVAERWMRENAGVTGGPRCAIGAISEASTRNYKLYRKALVGLRFALNSLSLESVSEFNDTHTQEEVVALFDKAIEKELQNAV